MDSHPLAPPASKEALLGFLEHFRLSKHLQPEELLRRVVGAFATIPYENLTKIIRDEEAASPERARRHPAQVLSDHYALGAGGTCFSLTATLIHLLRALGYQSEPILADRHYGANTHCALLVRIEGKPHLLDPGYLIVEPVPLNPHVPRDVPHGFNKLLLSPRPDGKKLDLYAVQRQSSTRRLTYKVEPVDAAEFLRAWDLSFGWDMMRYPLLTRVDGGRQLYLRANRYQVRSFDGVRSERISTELLVERIARDFCISPAVAARAISILEKRGDIGGHTADR
jgi:arylamine N-acetyltransferase